MTTAMTEAHTSMPMPLVQAREMAELLKALGDPTRLRILTALDGACVPVSAVVTATGLRQPTVSHHLRILRDRRLVRGERRGSSVYYCLEAPELGSVLNALAVLAGGAGEGRDG